ncbi:MAG: class I tRNA ligase family protein [Candidatus Phytoplasma australasiaticum]|uniref:Methionine--tRNA ligase n=2 Tax=16SrII (Peanut WB group) TaxID=85621 RepID=A0A9K3WRI0_9MOLU|nr:MULTISPECIES: class I tRNA ligase family protein [Phytoplasma]MDV3155129.1 class I tRNA ligase family protein [Sweet potato little leaf phytoplasma]MCG3566803.1 class I tRNA ligase family protein [Sesame phyllody phytoplasma]MDO8031237.1 class I tRNA ligase family protein [Candidatus Phytoplasma australasiaticum]MDO8031602.1 class I tRNA ligase family protein [Candidatus Phytoplasma australasiaticum]MDO8046651.1 class I tRNA ligase family protein [Candidatus Phytoplasma australasiaticum]
MMKKDKFFITTSIVYTSALPHIGNVYEMILADAIARFKKMEGYSVFFQTGTDEHGQKIENKALMNKMSNQEYVDFISYEIKQVYKSVNIEYDYFIRTTNEKHKQYVQKFIDQLFQQKDIYLGIYQGWYSISEESYVSEKDLIDKKLPSGETPIWMQEEVYFFKLSKYQPLLLQYLKENPDLIKPLARRKEILNLLKEPLADLSISRTSFKWGIPLPFDNDHITYVWFDALSNYITSLLDDPGKDYSKNWYDHKNLVKYWPPDLQIIGKDIVRFHLIYYLSFLFALKLPLPKQFLIHPWILFNDRKMSKSTQNVVYVDDLKKIFPIDAIRYFVLHEIPYASDGCLTYDLMFERYNTDLINTVGNLLSRSLGMLKKYRDNKIVKVNNFEDELGLQLSNLAISTLPKIRSCMKDFKVSEAIENIMHLARYGNKYIDLMKPWELFKSNCPQDINKLNYFLYNAIENLRFIGILLQPFLPTTAQCILDQIQSEENTFESLKVFGITKNKILVGQKDKLFQRFEKEKLKIFFN